MDTAHPELDVILCIWFDLYSGAEWVFRWNDVEEVDADTACGDGARQPGGEVLGVLTAVSQSKAVRKPGLCTLTAYRHTRGNHSLRFRSKHNTDHQNTFETYPMWLQSFLKILFYEQPVICNKRKYIIRPLIFEDVETAICTKIKIFLDLWKYGIKQILQD